ncbi:MAG TPA: T9SS type A sorting domain-containing protein [Bacteroidetes bacterium]|nr:T9SS type A sorting domain-containing protein [Bacteroidota bacterium]
MFNCIFNQRSVSFSILSLIALFSILAFVFLKNFSETETDQQQKIYLNSFDQLPMRFEKNMGQAEPGTDFLFRDKFCALSLSSGQTIMSLQQPNRLGQKTNFVNVTMHLVNANLRVRSEGVDELITKSNYFIGNDPLKWHTDITNYEKVKFTEVYPGIDLVYYGRDGKLEYDFNVSPGADPGAIALLFEKSTAARITESGDLLVKVGTRQITMQAPVAYQEMEGERTPVAAQFVARGNDTFGFEIGDYDASVPLVIDPVLVYSTFLGGSNGDESQDIAIDANGFIYITGSTANFPVTDNAAQKNKVQSDFWGYYDAFVAKLSPDGSALIYATYLGGDSTETIFGIAVDAAGSAYVTGSTVSDNFPTHNAVQGNFGGGQADGFITKLTSDGSAFVYSTYLGGSESDFGRDIAVDQSGNACVIGETNSDNFPVANAMQPTRNDSENDAFVTKLNSEGSAFIFSTFLGGSGRENAEGIAVDNADNIYLTGFSYSSDFPIVNGYRKSKGWFVTKMNPQASTIIFSTKLTGGYGIAVDEDGQVYVAGSVSQYTYRNFYTTNAIQPTYGGGDSDGFVAKLSADGSEVLFSTFLGGSAADYAYDIAVDANGNAFVTGRTQSIDFPMEKPTEAAYQGSVDAFVTGIASDGLSVLFSSYVGGSSDEYASAIAVGPNGHVFITGKTYSDNFPTASPLQGNKNGYQDAFITEIDLELQEPSKVLLVKVMQDSLGREPQPVANTEFGVYRIDLSAQEDPLTFVNYLTSDDDGLLGLPLEYFAPGDPFFLRVDLGARDAVKANHDDLDGQMLRFFSDNLHINNEGNINAAKLSANKLDTTITYMEHTSLAYNLLVSIEWPASDDYVADLKAAFRFASNKLYDISNGQAFFQTIAIYDNKKYWEDADLRIHADNTQWPLATLSGISKASKTDATINLPPKHYGSKDDNVNSLFAEEPLYFYSLVDVQTIVHEFGHYGFGFWDEYENAAGNTIDIFTNYGFMDGGPLNQRMSSEMSAFVISGYEQTAQFAKTGKTCWDFWHASFDTIPKNNFGAIYATIKTPAAMGLTANQSVTGPNEDPWYPDFDINAMMDFVVKTSSFNDPRPAYLMVDKETGQPAAGVVVIAGKANGRTILQGKTVLYGADRGKIRPLGLQTGDKLRAAWRRIGHRGYSFAEVEVTGSALAKTSAAKGEAIVVELQPVQGSYTLLPQVSFDSNGGLMFSAAANKAFNGAAQLEISSGSGDLQVIDLNTSAAVYSAALPEGDYGNASLYFRATDSTDTAFFLPMNVTLLPNSGEELIAARDNIRLLPQTGSTAKQYIVTTSPFPVPQEGLPDSLHQASPLVSLQAFPENSDMRTQLRITIEADSLKPGEAAAIVIYRWQDGWQPVATDVNLAYGIASTTASEPGFYMAFLDLTREVTGIRIGATFSEPLPRGFALQQNYPNPFNPSTDISYQLSGNSEVELSIYDQLGRKINTLFLGSQAPGNYTYRWGGLDNLGNRVASGIYILRLQVNLFSQSRKMLLLK